MLRFGSRLNQRAHHAPGSTNLAYAPTRLGSEMKARGFAPGGFHEPAPGLVPGGGALTFFRAAEPEPARIAGKQETT